jgi:methionyl-tRNA formyltransferase
MEKLKVKILSSYYGSAYHTAVTVINNSGAEIIHSGVPDIIICPDYDSIIPASDLYGVRYGALIFHPSPLPRMRGRNAIKRQYAAGDKVGGGTWFWANGEIDRGDICEQQICIINKSVRPRDYYENVIIPIMANGLRMALNGIIRAEPRRIKQIL